MPETVVYLPGEPFEPRGPLARYLPRLSSGVVSTWLGENVEARPVGHRPLWRLPGISSGSGACRISCSGGGQQPHCSLFT